MGSDFPFHAQKPLPVIFENLEDDFCLTFPPGMIHHGLSTCVFLQMWKSECMAGVSSSDSRTSSYVPVMKSILLAGYLDHVEKLQKLLDESNDCVRFGSNEDITGMVPLPSLIKADPAL